MSKKIIFCTRLILIIFISSSALAIEKPKKITFVCGNIPSEGLVNLYTDAFKRMGIEFDYYVLPAKRAGVVANRGEADGEISRIYSYSESFHNLVRVSEANNVMQFKAYSCNPNIKLNGWKSLEDKNYYIDYRLGVKHCELNILLRTPRERVFAARKLSVGINKLLHHRTDIFIDVEDLVERYLNSEEFKKNNMQLYEVGTMDSITTHAFLHEKYKDLEPELSRVLKEIKKEKIYEL